MNDSDRLEQWGLISADDLKSVGRNFGIDGNFEFTGFLWT